MRWCAPLVAAALAGGACSDPSFECQTGDDCGIEGRCEATGYCSFEDTDCDSGRRYGRHASGALAGQCVQDGSAGTVGSTGSATTDATGSTAQTTGAACEDMQPGARCLPAPSGWEGPVVGVEGTPDDPVACDPVGSELTVVFADLAAPPAQCGCSCDTASLSCPGLFLIRDADQNCTPTGPFDLLSEGDCESLDAVSLLTDDDFIPEDAEGVCAAVLDQVVPDAAWAVEVRTCDARLGGDCPVGQLCIGVGTGRACIHRDGDHPCPGEGYIDRRLAFRSLIDARSCSRCSCSGPQGACNPVVSAYDAADCNGAVVDTLTEINQCIATAGAASVGLDFTIAGSCPATVSSPMGAATPAEPVTVCCEPP